MPTRRGVRAPHVSALCIAAVLAACGDDAGPAGSTDAATDVDAEADGRPDSGSDDSTDGGAEADAGEAIADCTPSGDRLLSNPEFENDDESFAPWEGTGDVALLEQPPYTADTQPNAVGVLPGVGDQANARLSQRVEIPTGTTELTLSVKRCVQNEVIHGDADELTIALESADGDELDALVTLTSSDDERANCQYEPESATVDPAGRYDGDVAYLVVSAETSDNDQATFFLDTFSLRAVCP